MPIDYSVFEQFGGIPKSKAGKSQPEAKRAKRLDKEQQERECRAIVQKRDKGKCVVPGCKDRSDHLHHIMYRSKGGKWRSENIASLCASHHQMVHLGKITITGNTDDELFIHGSKAALGFKL